MVNALHMKTISCSLIISTFNWPEALELCLKSVNAQTQLPAEIIIADDGSDNTTKQLIDNFRKEFTIPVKHIWHENTGFRKTIITNEAVRNSSTGYIIQTDGDMILHPSFVKDHLQNAQPGYFIRGSRALLNEQTVGELLRNKRNNINFYTPGIRNRLNALRLPLLSIINSFFTNPYSVKGVIGCNMSYYKNDFIAVNGNNNDIIGWGREDSELAARLINKGIKKKQVKYSAVCYHIHHNLYSREHDEKNIEIKEEAVQFKKTFCTNGYNNHYPVSVWQ